MAVLLTGADGFIGKNLGAALRDRGIAVVPFVRGMNGDELAEAVERVDFVFHVAGVCRPEDPEEFWTGNVRLTESLCDRVRSTGRRVPILFTSSIQAGANGLYGETKLAAEQRLTELHDESGVPVYVFRLPNVFGKWSRPNYNSAVATFCHNIARDLPVEVSSSEAVVPLVYVDDAVNAFIRLLETRPDGLHRPDPGPVYSISVGDLAAQIREFRTSRESMTTGPVGTGLARALYATYLSFMAPEQFSYTVPVHADHRGRFVEILKTRDSGQFSFFTAHAGVTRGGHYHHTKSEKFLVLQGRARFCFRNVSTGQTHEVSTDAERPEIVESIPGWWHDITNVGDGEMIVMLWANEVFDRTRPDTIAGEASG